MTERRLDLIRLTEESLKALAAGDAGTFELRLLRSAQRSQLLLVLRSLLDHDSVRHRHRAASAASAWRLLAAAQESDPAAVDAVLADPTVMAWSMRLLRRLTGAAPVAASSAPLWADLGQFHALAAAAALRAELSATVRVPAHRGLVWLPGAGVAGTVSGRRWSEAEIRVGAEGTVVRGEAGEVRLPRTLAEPAPGWHPLPVLWHGAPCGAGAAASLRLDTVTPYRDFQTSPRAPWHLDERRTALWRGRVAGACDLLAHESPADAAALAALVRVLVPRAFPGSPGGLVASASSPEAFGAVMLSLPDDEKQTAAVLVHETRHQQLNVVLALVPLVHAPGAGPSGAGERLYYAPWRSDPRPAQGLLHGAYAFSGVARFWRGHRDAVTGAEAARAAFEFAVFREQVEEAVAALRTGGDLTEAGDLFVAEIAAGTEGWRKEEVLPGPARLAAHYCALRRAVWRARHTELGAAAARRAAADWTAGRCAPPLPPPRLRPRPDTIRMDTFGSLARLYLSAPGAFARRRSRAERADDPVRAAECAAVAGDGEQAARRYARWPVADPYGAEAWIGSVLARRDGTPGAALLLARPEAVAAVRRAVADAGAVPPSPLELAAWLCAGDGPGAGRGCR
ncbi:HEXXH motif-containing putative peptide modification protein [Streptomyces spectabilis]|uniref:aKG-HExxH-type peptide beta-hydroxylase n=1 Tax=Streptomyces spectabilis TaxID=68270 RepID=UPI0033E4B2EA